MQTIENPITKEPPTTTYCYTLSPLERYAQQLAVKEKEVNANE